MTSHPAPPSTAGDLRLITGAKAIAETLGLDERQVYALREAAKKAEAAGKTADCPIGNLPGVGLCARAASLEAWLERHGVV
ncbi:hypothetical protein [Marinicauda sp. Alg238-R41]|jgi:hypothetical protein|uniref:hypothetical protein n=1 Tax=Marinicauda sp. Alg238-R41 TaxID=2993447 RepID=UPI0022E77D2B|nr:hypothetical protein [Marinicauda sp. Alg238-R41]